jgi:hypothetical protein
MRNLLFSLIGTILLFSCNQSPNKQTGGEQQSAEQGFYGEKISGEKAISGSELFAMMQERDSVWVTMKSKIVSNCQKSGCWMDLDMGNDEVVKVSFKDYAFVIPIESQGKTATVEGFAMKELISVELLQHYAEDAGKTPEEISAITEEEYIYTFEAKGVIIED